MILMTLNAFYLLISLYALSCFVAFETLVSVSFPTCIAHPEGALLYRVIFAQQKLWGNPLTRAIGAEPLSVLSTCVTKQTGDMVYSEARRGLYLSIRQHMTMLYALEREFYLGSTFAVLIELSEGRDVSSGPEPGPSDLRGSDAGVRRPSTDQDRQRRTVCGHRADGAVQTLDRLDEARDRT
jgi:hypothetical protein